MRLYVCGPNLYGGLHVGHALSYAVFDVLRRYLEYRGYQVRHVQNFTDIEDRIIERAAREGRPVAAIAEEHIARFFREMDTLGVRRAHAYPRASEVIPTIVQIIDGLLARGYAYTVDGDVYFRVTAFPRYLQLSHRTAEELQAGARVEVDPRKAHPMDFALWKAARPGEPSWPSPWGPGRPGWHIECTAMNLRFLGEQIDIHGGGQDLIFPHHENEIAQAEAYTGKPPFARYWVHHALLRPAEGEEKMTRHLGNIVSLAEALERHEPDAIRAFLLGTHYRTPLRWTDEAVAAAARGVERLRTALRNADDAIAAAPPDDRATGGLDAATAEARGAFERAMDDDLNTPQALAALFRLAAELNRVADAILKGTGRGRAGVWAARDLLRELGGVLGLRLEAAALGPEVVEGLRTLLAEVRAEHPALFPDAAGDADPEMLIGTLLAGRQQARAAGAYALADWVRARLGGLGIVVEDFPGGSRWRLARRRS